MSTIIWPVHELLHRARLKLTDRFGKLRLTLPHRERACANSRVQLVPRLHHQRRNY